MIVRTPFTEEIDGPVETLWLASDGVGISLWDLSALFETLGVTALVGARLVCWVLIEMGFIDSSGKQADHAGQISNNALF